jgi:short-subunit dehydrogenase
MELGGKRFLVAGASGQLGGRLARGLAERGSRVIVAGRDQARLDAVAGELEAPSVRLDILDADSCTAAITAAVDRLGGLDGLVISTGVVAFGRAGELDRQVEAEVMRVNALGPISLIAAALPHLEAGGALVGLSAVVAEYPTAGMAAYSASKAALSSYLSAVRRERRRDLAVVLDVRPGHMETGFPERALAGEPPRLPEPEDADALVESVLEALVAERRELRYDPRERRLFAE